jgi:hypothetical protein
VAAPTPEVLDHIEARLRAILVPYETRLETATIYNLPTLRRPGAKAHDWFAFVKPGPRHVSFFLLPVYTFPELREWLSPALAKRLTGKSTFTFGALDEPVFAELEGLVARAFARYMEIPGADVRPGPP